MTLVTFEIKRPDVSEFQEVPPLSRHRKSALSTRVHHTVKLTSHGQTCKGAQKNSAQLRRAQMPPLPVRLGLRKCSYRPRSALTSLARHVRAQDALPG